MNNIFVKYFIDNLSTPNAMLFFNGLYSMNNVNNA